ncbi:ATP-binding protein [Ectobacillus antri]|uniref:ATP-binding protein n=1 Tax=Ectobacillus antri TaxID=2486280 RepID=UPI000F5A13A4|nr:ATP-binding protein [Ectobacillus antri]
MKHMRIMPDSRLENGRVEHFAQSLCSYRSMFERFNKETKRLDANFFSWEIMLEPKNTSFHITLPEDAERIVQKAVHSSWPQVTVQEQEDILHTFTPALTSVMEMRHHYFLAMRVDRRGNWLKSLLEVLNIMQTGDKVIIQVFSEPAFHDWYVPATEAYMQFKRGSMPQRLRFTKKDMVQSTIKAAAYVTFGAISIVTELLTGEEPEKVDLSAGERGMILRDGPLRTETVQKTRGDAYDVSIRIGIQSTNTKQAHLLNRAVSTAFREFDGDNQLQNRITNTKKTFSLMKERRKGMKLASDYMSIPEIARLFTLPPLSLQEKYHIPGIKLQETEVAATLFEGGLLLGEQTHRGETKQVYMPTTNWDELCLPVCAIGGMGQGKTDGFGANRVVEAVRNGFGAMFIDPAKHQVSEQVKKVLRPDQYEIINIKHLKPSFDWCEAQYSEYGKGLLADAVLSFFEDSLEDSVQTERYLRAFIMGMQTAKLNEVFRIMEDMNYLEEVAEKLPDGMHKTTLMQFSKESENMRMKIVKPIYNRMDMIMGDSFMMECFHSDVSLDFVKLLSQKKAIIIDVAKKDLLTPKQINLIGNLIMTKVNLAMQMRKEEDQFPFFVLIDEPHQFNRSAKLWESMAVESRKWRVGFVWLFHYWEQLPKQAQSAVKNALPHYHLYPTSKETWLKFKEEIAPFDLTDCINLKRFHAINILRTNGESTKPFIAHMAAPPSIRIKNKR